MNYSFDFGEVLFGHRNDDFRQQNADPAAYAAASQGAIYFGFGRARNAQVPPGDQVAPGNVGGDIVAEGLFGDVCLFEPLYEIF